MAYGDADLQYLIGQDFGVDVVVGAVTTKGQYDPRTVEVLDGMVVAQKAQDLTVLVQIGVLTLTTGAAITVGGTSYTVLDWNDEDASITRIRLAT